MVVDSIRSYRIFVLGNVKNQGEIVRPSPLTVIEAIAGGEGKVKVGDTVWLANGPDAAVGQRVTIIGADGNRLRVSAE